MEPYEEFDEYLDWEDDPYEALREALSPAYRNLPAENIEMLLATAGLSAEEMERNLSRAAGRAGRVVQTAAPAVLPTAGTVLGTAFGGPMGGALGRSLGQMAGGVIGNAGRQGEPRPAASRPSVTQTPSVSGSPAAAQLLQVLTRPELLQSLLSMTLGQAGQRQTNVGATPVPVAAFANLLGQLANQAAAEYNAVMNRDSESLPAYLLDSNGSFLVDPSVPEQRAARLIELLNEAVWQEAGEAGDWDEAWDWEDDDEDTDDFDDLDALYDALEMVEADDW